MAYLIGGNYGYYHSIIKAICARNHRGSTCAAGGSSWLILLQNGLYKEIARTVIINQTVAKTPQKLADTLKITPKEATEVIAYKETAQPVATYYTQAPTLHDAAVVTKNAIKDKSPNIPKEATEKSDRTAVVQMKTKLTCTRLT